MIMFSLQPTMTHGHDLGARDSLSGKETRQERVEGGKRIVQHTAGQSHDRRIAEISH